MPHLRQTKLLLNAFLPPFIWAGTIFMFSSFSQLPGPEQAYADFILKKIAHMLVYGVLYALVLRGTVLVTSSKDTEQRLVIPLLITMLYAISDEFHQSLVPGRSATLRDIGYDLVGMLVVFLKKYGYI